MNIRALGLSVVLAGAAILAVPSASASDIDLSTAPQGAFDHFTVDGYTFQWVGYGDQQTVVNVGGSYVLEDADQSNGSGAGVTITRADGGLFTLNSIDVNGNGSNNGYNIQIGNDYYDNPSALTTVYPSGQTNVSSFFINIVDGGSNYQVSNINVTAATPEPSSLALLGTGVLGMFGMARRRIQA